MQRGKLKFQKYLNQKREGKGKGNKKKLTDNPKNK